jgi:diacylglycerol kinase (ATP)
MSWYRRAYQSFTQMLPFQRVEKGRIFVVVNPAAGQDRPVLKTFNRIFGKAGFEWDMAITKVAGDAERLAAMAVEDGVDIVAVYGGDGSVMEVSRSLANTQVPLGIIPGGTGNVLSMELGIPRTIEAACNLLVSAEFQYRLVDMGLVNGVGFMLRASSGLEATVVEFTDRELKERYGLFAYLMSIPQALREQKTAHYHLTIDSQEYEVDGLACLVANAGNFGLQGLAIAPEIAIDDGVLDVFVIRNTGLQGVFSMAASVTRSALGAVLDEPQEYFPHWRGKQIMISSDPVQQVQLDGDLFGESPMEVTLLPKTVRVIVPPAAGAGRLGG